MQLDTVYLSLFIGPIVQISHQQRSSSGATVNSPRNEKAPSFASSPLVPEISSGNQSFVMSQRGSDRPPSKALAPTSLSLRQRRHGHHFSVPVQMCSRSNKAGLTRCFFLQQSVNTGLKYTEFWECFLRYIIMTDASIGVWDEKENRYRTMGPLTSPQLSISNGILE